MTDGYKIKRILVWQGGQEKQVYPATWKPGSNTLVYLPLNGDANDASGNSRNGTLPTASAYSWEYINGSSGKQYLKSYGNQSGDFGSAVTGVYGTISLGSGDRTVSVWTKFISGINSTQVSWVVLGRQSGGTAGEWFGLRGMDQSSSKLGILRYTNEPYTNSFSYSSDWTNFIITYNDTDKAKMYVNGTQVSLPYKTSQSFNTVGTGYSFGVCRASNSGKEIGFSDFIIENKTWSADEITAYYNLTKSNYGL